ncbi:S9 family peptidase [uncultured Marinococcus sp.]|uniref:alpha/beta hydrolase family protein n=1 Tax=uncultured Marinococcus sp. TaxID=487012 RepID=UPI002607AB78|nr:CocE/NonD family hydrolase [uncultured Marinococcus sp.]
MKKTKSRAKLLTLIAVLLCVISGIGASFVQTSGAQVEVKDMRWETPSGKMMSALLYVPKSATENNQAPGIVTSHGWYNNREMQDLNFVEYSRRGYVVMSIDMYGHGNSEAVKPTEWEQRGTGMYDAVELMADLPYVNTENIGITGHSNGARAANWSIDVDNQKENPLISSVLLVGHDADYTNPQNENYYNKYGGRDVGIVAAQYDEFFFRTQQEDGSFTKPRNYINTDNAQSFLHFGASPTDYTDERESYTMYEQEIQGTEASRVIYNPAQTHPWNHFSGHVVYNSLNFFESSLGAPDPIHSGNQIWQWKALFNFIGLVGFVMFLVSFCKLLLFTKPFSSLRASSPSQPSTLISNKQKAWFWGGLFVSAVFSGLSYLWLFNWTTAIRPSFFPQSYTFYVGMWAAINGLFAIGVILLSRIVTPKEERSSLKDIGVTIQPKSLGKTILLALIVCVATYSLVFLSDYLFKTDYRLWVLGVKSFTPDKLVIALKYLPFFILFFVANSIAINCFNYVWIGKKEWINTLFVALFNVLGVLVIFVIQYSTFFITGEVFFSNVSAIVGIWLTTFLVILPGAAIVSRKIFRVTLNPYLGGLIYAIMVTVISVTNTLTQI